MFKLDSARNQTVLYSFGGGTDGANPSAGLIVDPAGNLYGTTLYGGLASCSVGPNLCGTVFEVDTTGKETVLYNYSGGTDGGILPVGCFATAPATFTARPPLAA